MCYSKRNFAEKTRRAEHREASFRNSYGTMTTTAFADRLESVRSGMAAVHRGGANKSIEWKRSQLKALRRLIVENKQAILSAIFQDLGKHAIEAEVGEVGTTLIEIDELLAQLSSYAQPHQVPSPGLLMPAFSEIRYEPLRSPGSLIISPFNYPINLSLVPVAGSLAAGNPVVLKPSEMASNVSSLLARLVPRYFDSSVFAIFEGGIPETTELLRHPWGIVFFTGSSRVGKIVSAQAAQTLTPVILELGGKSPTYIAKDCPDMRVVADRIAWGKTVNGGQTCVAPDYVLCHRDVLDQFVNEVKESLVRMYGEDAQKSNLTRVINEGSAKRIIEYIKEIEIGGESKGKIIHGGSNLCDASARFVAPTIILEPTMDTELMKEENFGPVLPIVPISTDEEAIEFIAKQQLDMTPLALYVFTRSSGTFEKVAKSCPSATLVRNDVIVQFGTPSLPIGGLGTSGCGNYHGKHSIESFSHKRATIYKPATAAFEYGGVRYAPYDDWGGLKGKTFLMLTKLPKIPVMHSPLIGYALLLAFVNALA